MSATDAIAFAVVVWLGFTLILRFGPAAGSGNRTWRALVRGWRVRRAEAKLDEAVHPRSDEEVLRRTGAFGGWDDDGQPLERWRQSPSELRGWLCLLLIAGFAAWSGADDRWSTQNTVAFGVLCWLVLVVTVWWPWSRTRRRAVAALRSRRLQNHGPGRRVPTRADDDRDGDEG